MLASFGKPGLFHSESDDVRPTELVPGAVYRSSILSSLRRSHERIAIGCVPDLTRERPQSLPEWSPRTTLPTLGFTGHVATGLRSLGYLRRGWQHFYGFTLRERALKAFERSALVRCDFVRRRINLGPPMAGVDTDKRKSLMRNEYVASVFENAYSLCVRGTGNWSYRFFETLSAGRIPVLIDTDSALPLEAMIDWDRHVCRIPLASLGRSAEILAEFHATRDESQLQATQKANRKLWLETLCPAAFFPAALRDLAANSSGRATIDT